MVGGVRGWQEKEVMCSNNYRHTLCKERYKIELFYASGRPRNRLRGSWSLSPNIGPSTAPKTHSCRPRPRPILMSHPGHPGKVTPNTQHTRALEWDALRESTTDNDGVCCSPSLTVACHVGGHAEGVEMGCSLRATGRTTGGGLGAWRQAKDKEN